jgi:hypothetical protein
MLGSWQAEVELRRGSSRTGSVRFCAPDIIRDFWPVVAGFKRSPIEARWCKNELEFETLISR